MRLICISLSEGMDFVLRLEKPHENKAASDSEERGALSHHLCVLESIPSTAEEARTKWVESRRDT